MSETTQPYITRADTFAAIIDSADLQWDAPTPCDDWSVRDVVAHAVETQRDFLQRQGFEVGVAPDLIDPAAAWRSHSTSVGEILAVDGVAEREYDGYFGRTTIGATMADFYGWDLVVHGSDIARATGQPWSISEQEADDLHRTADGWGDALYSEGVCGTAIPVAGDASAADRLLARLGRDPAWRPAAASD